MRNDQLQEESLNIWFERIRNGDYGKALDGVWYVKIPNGSFPGSLGCLKNHSILEHEDRTITVHPSILQTYTDGQTWHGYLERGVLREV